MARSWTESQTAAMDIHGKTLLVSAAAGSGKTSVLTERIIRSLTDRENPADLSRMLVVTFTRAAAAELKSRIATALTEAMAEHPDDSRLSRQLFLLGGAQISTIDAFFQKTVRANFEQLGIPATFRIADEQELLPISMEILDGVITELYDFHATEDTEGTMLSRISSNRFAKALDHLMSNRSDGSLNTNLLRFYKSFERELRGIDLLETNASILRQAVHMPFLQTPYGIALSKTLTSQFEGYLEVLRETRFRIEGDPDNYGKLSGLISSDTEYCERVLEALADRNYKKLQNAVQSFAAGRFQSGEKTPAVLFYQNWRLGFREDQKKLTKRITVSEEALSKQCEQTAELCEMLHKLFRTYETRFLEEKKSRGILEYNDVRSLLYKMLALPDGTPSDFARSLSEQYDTVYIDEYQDVDFIQDRIFACIGENRRFMVGDIKQSIYGFRGSEPSIFADYRRAMPLYTEEEAQGATGVCVFMSDNFRCDQPVIDFTNKICAFLFSASEESIGYRPQDDLIHSKRAPENPLPNYPVPVQVCVFDAAKSTKSDESEELLTDKGEAVWVANEILRLLREETLDDGKQIQPSDIVLLVRSAAHGEPFVRQLQARGVPAATASSDDFLYDPILIDLLNLLRAVDNPYRDLPLSEFLLSPLGHFTVEELSRIREDDPQEHSLFDALEAYANAEESPLAKKAAELVGWIGEQQKIASVQPADRFLHLLYLDPRLQPYAAEDALIYLYEQARAYQRSSWCGLYGFLQHFSKLMENKKLPTNGFSKAENAVTVMTIHHSKGLEFPVVFLCNSGARFNKDDLRRSLLYHRRVGLSASLYNEETGGRDDTLLKDAVRACIEEDQSEENIRTLYVALTRARERLYVTGTLNGKWETMQTNYQSIRRGNRHSILTAGSYLEWILAAFFEKPFDEGTYPAVFHYYTDADVAATLLPDDACKEIEDAAISALETEFTVKQYASVLENQKRFTYPLSFLHLLPTKAAASRLSANLLDELLDPSHEDTSIAAHLKLMQKAETSFDRLLSEKHTPSATDIGTATHAFLEFCDFARLADLGVEAECQRLIQEKFLSVETVEILHRKQLDAFCQSNLMQWIKDAKDIRREQKFGILVPMHKLTSQEGLSELLQKHSLFVQGSIDLLITTKDDRLLLIDYKTDRLTESEKEDPSLLAQKMKEMHQAQLACYAAACQELFGKRPNDICIYSLPAGRAISIELDDAFL